MNIVVALLVLSLIIIVHELGHFLLAKKNGIKVTEFSVGMGPRIASFVKNGTRYSLKALPIGGSCMMLGEDEAIEDEGAFYKKGVWARFSVIFAGPLFNFILAFILAIVLLGANGVDVPRIAKVEEGAPASLAGLKEGDMITEINGSRIHIGREIDFLFYFNPLTEENVQVTFERDGVEHTTLVTPEYVNKYLMGCNYTALDNPAEMELIHEGYPLEQAGLMVGDIIVGVNGNVINTGNDLANYFKENPISDAELSISYQRDGVEKTVSIIPKLSSSGYQIGWNYASWETLSPLKVIEYSFYQLKFNVVTTMKSLGYLVTGKISVKEVSGPVGIVNHVDKIVTVAEDYGLKIMLLELVSFCILLSANLGVINLLPIPAMDGGRLVFILIEAIRRKPVPKEKEAIVHMIGMVALMIFMVFILFNDVKNIFG